MSHARRLALRLAASAAFGAAALAPAALLAAATAAPRPTPAAADPLRGLEADLARAVADWHVPGLAVAVVKDDAVVLTKAFGVREHGRPEPVTPRTLFAIGSTTKAMTAAAIGMLVDEGRLRWDDPVVRHLPALQLQDPYVTRDLTIRDLLTHRTGVGETDFLWYRSGVDRPELLRRLWHAPQAAPVRGRFIYQNVMYQVAGMVIEAASARPWAEFVRERLFVPLGMSDTVPTLRDRPDGADVASPHFDEDGPLRVIRNATVDAVPAAGAVWSSVADMARWSRFLLAGCKVDGRALLAEASCSELFSPQTIVGRDAFYPTAQLTRPHWTTYALGWFQQDYAGRALDYHTGSIDGMSAIHGLVRDERLGVVVLANLDHAELRHAILLEVVDRYEGRPPRRWNAELLKLYRGLRQEAEERQKKDEAARVPGTHPSLAMAAYAGAYTDPLRGGLQVSLEPDGVLRLRASPELSGRLEHWHYDTFRIAWDLEWLGKSLVTFALDARGRPSRLELEGAAYARSEPAAR